MSRAGRRARLARLVAAEQPVVDPTEAERTAALIADRDEWLRRAGTVGWQAEQCRRRKIRTEVAATRWRSALWQNGRRAA